MKKNITFLNIILSALFAAAVLLAMDILYLLADRTMPLAVGCLAAPACWLFFMFCKPFDAKKKAKVGGKILIIGLVIISALTLAEINYMNTAGYRNMPKEDNTLFSEKKVLFIAAEPGEEYFLAGGIMEQYAKAGSDVYVMFLFNGNTAQSINDAVAILKSQNIRKENILFLGYDSNWQGDTHIYNAAPHQLMTSAAGKTETYAAETHLPFNRSNYTLQNLQSDLYHAIKLIRPTIIFSGDYDAQPGCSAAALLTDKVLGEILAEDSNYTPTVLKGYTAGIANTQTADYFAINSLASQNVFSAQNSIFSAMHPWEERLRFPFAPNYLSRSLFGANGYKSLKRYSAQQAYFHATQAINGDKVFWQRRCDSLCRTATITASDSSATTRLNDFMILDNADITAHPAQPFDNICTADEITVTLDAPTDIDYINLYDNPSPDDNILKAQIHFDDGTQITLPALQAEGGATHIPVKKKHIQAFTVQILSKEGKTAGLTEIEAFSTPAAFPDSFIKITDTNGHFVYDYYITNETENFALYASDGAAPLTDARYTVTATNSRCRAAIENGKITVNCPQGLRTYVVIHDTATGAKDRVHIMHPTRAQRIYRQVMQTFEKNLFKLHPHHRGYFLMRLYDAVLHK